MNTPMEQPRSRSPDARNARGSAGRLFDPRTVPKRRGAGRAIGIALGVFVVVGAGVGAGCVFWRNELAPHELVRRPLPDPGVRLNLATVHGASAAPRVAEGSTAAAGRSQGDETSSSRKAEAAPAARSGDAEIEPGGLAAAEAAPAARVANAGSPMSVTEQAGATPHSGPGGGARIEIRKRKRADHVADSLERGYAALGAGNTSSASEAYRAVLGDEPRNRDALLGLAAVAAREGRWDEAAGHYSRVLASDPTDTIARAALIAIDERDPTQGESRLKTLLWSEPQAAYLHFNLGNVYAAQSRWPEAQRSYFNAYRFDSGNADYAYNLAVSLDHLARPESALDFYREALALARGRPTGFEAATVLARIREMDSSAEAEAAPASRTPEPADVTPAASIR